MLKLTDMTKITWRQVIFWKTYPIRTGQRLTIDNQGAERRVCGQALVPLTRSGLRGSFHEVPLQLADTGMMPEQLLLGLLKLLYGGKLQGEKQCGGGTRQERGSQKI